MTIRGPHETVALINATFGVGGPQVDVEIANGHVHAIRPAQSSPSRRGVARFDCRGTILVPGLEDAHVHMSQWASARRRVDLTEATSAQHAATIVANAHAMGPKTEPGSVLVGYGFRDGLWSDAPTDRVLEQALPGTPVVLQSNDMHTAWLSPAALQLLGNPANQKGILREQDCYAAVAALTRSDEQSLDASVVDATQAAARRGVTRILDFEYADTVTDWTRRATHYDIATRITCIVRMSDLDRAINLGWNTGQIVSGTRGLVDIGHLKIFIDGSLNSRTAYCHHAYPQERLGQNLYFGLEEMTSQELNEVVRRGAAHGLLPALHAIGDRAVEMALNALDHVGRGGRIEHAQLVASRDLPRFGRPGLLVGVQPAHAPDDRDVAGIHWEGRTERAFALASLLSAGADLRLGSDAPNAVLDPWDGIASAVARTDDDRPPWHPEQALPLGAALRAASGGRSGISVGDVADLTLLSADPRGMSFGELKEMPIGGTLLSGRWTWREPSEVLPLT